MHEFAATATERLKALVERLAASEVRQLAGDASTRLYYRVRLDDDQTRIIAVLPEPFEPDQLPFLDTLALLQTLTIRVPRVYESMGPDGILVLEDLGDRLLQNEVTHRRADKRQLYAEAIDLLTKLQIGARDLSPRSHLALRIAFDDRKFREELSFFRTHFLEGLRGARLDVEDGLALEASFENIARELASQTYALCHRDYHSRNLIRCSDDELAVIDFQDARLGPRVYDLVSLMNDSYVVHTVELVKEMTERFSRALGVDVANEYDLAALQRNLKALGTFGYQIVHRANEVYRPYLAPTLGLVRDNLVRNSRFATLRRVLARQLPELQ
ncbi:MAG TPA: phosphotransferase [Vicinamibacteria bacterium]|nr:phosphotransferase [Vicinamibacteria bacterium]